MSLDGAFLHLVKAELQDRITGGRVDKIHQPSKEEIIITFRIQSGTARLMFSANPSCARVNLTESVPENPKTPPMFCMLLRKHIGNGKLLNITQDGLERILNFDFECMNEIGDMVKIRLTAEIMGRCSNIILMTEKDGKMSVIDSIKRVTDDISSVRLLLPNIVYELPPREEKICLLNCDISETAQSVLKNENERLARAALGTLEGVSPLFSRECAFYTARDCDIVCANVTAEQRTRLEFFLRRASDILKGNERGKFTVVRELNGKPKDFCFTAVEQYSNAMIITECESANNLLDAFYQNRADNDRMKQRSSALLKMLMSTFERISRKLEAQRGELAACVRREEFRVCGDLISANIYRMQKGMNELVADDYINGGEKRIQLDARLSPSQNAQKYYSEYRKLETAEKMLTKLIKSGEDELAYVDSVFDEVSRTCGESELLEIRQELIQSGYIRAAGGKKASGQLKAQPVMKFTSSDGIEILVGRNNLQNDKLTMKTAKPGDMWLHTQKIAGSHVIICCESDIPDRTLTEAAQLAAYCSKARESTKVPVDYTRVRFVKKPNGAKPGMVIFTNNKTLLVDPDEQLFMKLAAK